MFFRRKRLVLKHAVKVRRNGDPPQMPLRTIPAGTPYKSIPRDERTQLCADHFHIKGTSNG